MGTTHCAQFKCVYKDHPCNTWQFQIEIHQMTFENKNHDSDNKVYHTLCGSSVCTRSQRRGDLTTGHSKFIAPNNFDIIIIIIIIIVIILISTVTLLSVRSSLSSNSSLPLNWMRLPCSTCSCVTWNISTVEHLPLRDLDLKSDWELKQLQKTVVVLTMMLWSRWSWSWR